MTSSGFSTGGVNTDFGSNKLIDTGNGVAESEWLDLFTISGGTGQGTVQFGWSLTGTLTAIVSCSGFSDPGAIVIYRALYDGQVTALAGVNTGCPAAPTSFGFARSGTLSYTFTYDTPFAFGLALTALTNAGGTADLSHSGLLTSLILPAGATVVTASGTNYPSPVPEPATLSLTAIGLVGAAVRRRTIRRR